MMKRIEPTDAADVMAVLLPAMHAATQRMGCVSVDNSKSTRIGEEDAEDEDEHRMALLRATAVHRLILSACVRVADLSVASLRPSLVAELWYVFCELVHPPWQRVNLLDVSSRPAVPSPCFSPHVRNYE